MSSEILPMTLGDIFDRTFNLIGKTFVRNIIIAAVFLLIPVVLLMIAADNFYSSIAAMGFSANNSAIQYQTGIQFLLPFLGGMILFVVAFVVLALATLFAEIAISYTVGKEIVGESVTLSKALQETFYAKWLYGIGQGLLKFLIIGGGIGVVVFFVSTFAVVIDSRMVLVLLIAILMVAIIPVLLFVIIKWYFSLTAVAVEDLGPVDSLRQSWFLVEGNWWRTFGILFLLSILTQFVVYIVSIPFTFGSMWSFYKVIFTAVGQTSGQPDPQAMQQAMKTLGPSVGIGVGVSSLLSLLITPVFTVVMYFDLRARKNDLPGTLKAAASLPVEPPPPETINPTSGGGIY
jgi:hypothetical protein